MKTKILYTLLAIMTIAFIVATSFLYQHKSSSAQSLDVAVKQLDYAIKLPTYFPFKVTKAEATTIKTGIYQEIRIIYTGSDPAQQIILKATDEHIKPDIFADKIKLNNGAEAIHVGGDVFTPPTNNDHNPVYSVPNFVNKPSGQSTVVYWEQDGLEYSIYGTPYPELIKMANSLK